jgi:hypothetical protein
MAFEGFPEFYFRLTFYRRTHGGPMRTTVIRPRLFQAGTLKFEIYDSRESAGRAAALAAAEEMRHQTQNGLDLGIIFATGASQLSMLQALTAVPGLPWDRIIGFHMDEYQGIEPDHFASFRRYLREQLTERVPIKEFYELGRTDTLPSTIQAMPTSAIRKQSRWQSSTRDAANNRLRKAGFRRWRECPRVR